MRVVAIVSARDVSGSAAAEFLRVLAALRAMEVSVSLHEAGEGVGALSVHPDLSEDGDRYLDALVSDDVSISGPDSLADALSSATSVLHLASPTRSGIPAVLVLPRGKRPSAEQLSSLLTAGQVRIE